jgi:hypothetical protein
MFEQTLCINLERRPDRWEKFLGKVSGLDWPFNPPERSLAIDGDRCGVPRWWKQGRGAWGCYRSHLNLIEKCVNEGVESILIFEDDAEFVEDFGRKTREFFESLPKGWEENSMIYIGGQHLHAKQYPPIKINENVYQPYNVNRTHAFAISGRMLKTVYRHLIQTQSWWRGHHIDHHLGRLHQKRQDPIFAPREWLALQDEGPSDISGKVVPEIHRWPGAEELA